MARQVLLGSGSSGGASEDDLRVPLRVEEQRGYVSPTRVSGKGKAVDIGSSQGEKEAGHGPVKKSRKSWVKSKQDGNYVVGEDIAWSGVLQMSKQTLVGRVMGRSFARKTVVDWVEQNWKEELGYSSVVDLLTRGWFVVNFTREEDLWQILNKSWSLDHSPILLNPWHPMFDASRERVDTIPIWVWLPALPLHFWDQYHLHRIGNIMGVFLEADLSFLETHMKQVGRILVNINIREGLAGTINLDWGPDIIPQILDYENIPFRCHRCHAYGHPVSKCSLHVRTLFGGR